MLATWHQAAPLFGFTALLMIGSAVPLALTWWVVRGPTPRRLLAPVPRYAIGILVAMTGIPVYWYTLLVGLIAVASVGCAPDAYECPF